MMNSNHYSTEIDKTVLKSDQRCIIVFAKAPIAGQVKTRMQPHLTTSQSAALHAALVKHAINEIIDAEVASLSLWAGSPSPFFDQIKAQFPNIELKYQYDGNLGERMQFAFEDVLTRFQQAVIIGSDCPFLSRCHYQQLFHALTQQSEVAIVPATDGGYVAMGLKRSDLDLATIFADIAWGESSVLADTLKRLADIAHVCLPALDDIDLAADLQKLQPAHQHILNAIHKANLAS